MTDQSFLFQRLKFVLNYVNLMLGSYLFRIPMHLVHKISILGVSFERFFLKNSFIMEKK